jgi:hypothetical protein
VIDAGVGLTAAQVVAAAAFGVSVLGCMAIPDCRSAMADAIEAGIKAEAERARCAALKAACVAGCTRDVLGCRLIINNQILLDAYMIVWMVLDAILKGF